MTSLPEARSGIGWGGFVLVLLALAVALAIDLWTGTGVVTGLLRLLMLLGRLLH